MIICGNFLEAQRHKKPRKLLLKDSTTLIRIAEILWESELKVNLDNYKPYEIYYRDSIAFVSGSNDSVYMYNKDVIKLYTAPYISINRYTCEVYELKMRH
jgi:hypothetical protein